MKWLAQFFLIALFSLPSHGEQPIFDVHVESFPDPERIIDRKLPVCFDRNLVRNSLNNLEAKNLSEELVEVCIRVARLKGLNVMDASKGRDCLHIGFEWEVREAVKERSCWKVFNSTFCSAPHGSIGYGKELKLFIYDFGFRPAKQVSEVRASMTSDNKGFNRYTAEVLCRGALHDYPKRLKEASYHVEPTFD